MLVLVGAAGAGYVVHSRQLFFGQANSLQQRWQRYEQLGVPASMILPLQNELRDLEHQGYGPIPHSWVYFGSAASIGQLGKQTQQVWTLAVAQAQQLALQRLTRLEKAQGTVGKNSVGIAKAQLALATTPLAYDHLASTWSSELRAWQQSQTNLRRLGGGLTGSLPSDVAAATTRVSELVGQAQSGNISTYPGPSALAEVKAYASETPGQQVSQHAWLMATLNGAITALQTRVAANQKAGAALQQAQSVLPAYEALGAALGKIPAELAQTQADYTAAQTTTQLDAVTVKSNQLYQQALAAVKGQHFCKTGLPAKAIYINVTWQELIAYQNGCPYIVTPVTTGMVGLRTPTGTYHIFDKQSPFQFISPWPPGNQYWYAPAWVNYVMEFINDGTFIHDWPDEPYASFGPGSENGPFASRGCVHVYEPVMAKLYQWTPIGTEVVVQ